MPVTRPSPIRAEAQRRLAFAQDVQRLMGGLDGVEVRPMFGGHGIFRHGLMFALTLGERLYFKTDELTVAAFEQLGLKPFQYTDRHGRQGSLRYHEAPAEVFEDDAVMLRWAAQAWEVALRAQAGHSGKARKGAPPVKAANPPRSVPSRKSGKPGPASLTDLPNLGPASAAMLAEAGIRTEQALRRLGAVRAFVRTRAVCPRASLNLLWALEGALSGRPWQEVAAHDRAALLMAVEDAMQEGVSDAE